MRNIVLLLEMQTKTVRLPLIVHIWNILSLSDWYTGSERVQISRPAGNQREALLKYEAYWITELETHASQPQRSSNTETSLSTFLFG